VLRRRLISREARCYAEAKQQIGELLNVVAVAHAIVAQDVAVGPEFLDDGGGVHFCALTNSGERDGMGGKWGRRPPFSIDCTIDTQPIRTRGINKTTLIYQWVANPI
jgi:hypothetical protein